MDLLSDYEVAKSKVEPIHATSCDLMDAQATAVVETGCKGPPLGKGPCLTLRGLLDNVVRALGGSHGRARDAEAWAWDVGAPATRVRDAATESILSQLTVAHSVLIYRSAIIIEDISKVPLGVALGATRR